MLIACPIVAALAAGIVSFALPPVYEAHAWLIVRPVEPIPVDVAGASSLTTDQILRTYADWMTQRPILEKVNADLNLGLRYDDLKKKVKVAPQPNTLLLDVSAQDTNPKVASDIANQLVVDFVDKVKQTQTQESQAATQRNDNLIPTASAVPPDKPISPNKTLNIAIAFAAGLLLAVGIAFLLDYLDQSIKSEDDLVGRLGLVPLGHIPFVPTVRGKRSQLVALDARSPSSEAYKALRTSVLFSTIDQQLKAIVITSAELGEGKSRTAANLSAALAQAGYKTLLIDADFRRPSQHRLFGKIHNVGLSNLIIQEATEGEVIKPVDGIPNLWLLASGPTPPNPSELLGSARMRELMASLWHEYSYVIIDTPPVNAVTDAAILAAAANATIVVVEQGRTTFPALRHGREILDRVGAHTIGAVFNKVRASAGTYSYGYGNYEASSNGAISHQTQEDAVEDRPVSG
jgi:receptor protein-tyrosine kinase